MRAANKATFGPEKKDRGLQKGGPRKTKKGSDGKKANKREALMELLPDAFGNSCRHDFGNL